MAEENKKFEDLTFGVAVNELSLPSYIQSITEYHSKLKDILSGNFELPLFLDTNVLLRYYETSLKYRNDLLNFFTNNSENIILTHNVQKEFLRNREEVIDKFISSSLNKFKKDFESKFIKGLDTYLNDIKSHLDDFPEIGDSINDIKSNINNTHEALSQKIKKIEDGLKELKVKDDLLIFLSSVAMLVALPKEEIEELKKQFDHLSKELDKKPSDRINKTASVFPGFLDIKEKKINPYGDYILFHEMIKFMKENNTDVIYLTYDVKGDWIQENGTAHSHYVQIAFDLTGKHLFILDAERYFSEKLKQNFEPVFVEDDSPRVISRLKLYPGVRDEEITYFNLLNSIFEKTGLPNVIPVLDNKIVKENLITLNDLDVVSDDLIIDVESLYFLLEQNIDKKEIRIRKLLNYINQKLVNVWRSLFDEEIEEQLL